MYDQFVLPYIDLKSLSDVDISRSTCKYLICISTISSSVNTHSCGCVHNFFALCSVMFSTCYTCT